MPKKPELTAEELIPIDATRCQAEHKPGSFMTFGPRTMQRCSKVPTWVAISVKGSKFYGAMALCDACKEVCKTNMKGCVYQRLKTKE
jgi:hypothetical protein